MEFKEWLKYEWFDENHKQKGYMKSAWDAAYSQAVKDAADLIYATERDCDDWASLAEDVKNLNQRS